MAKRYSGDVEVRLRWNGRAYEFTIRAPRVRGRGHMTPRELRLARKGNFSSPEAYDDAATRIIEAAEKAYGRLPANHQSSGKVVIARVFVSPCPQRSP